MTDKNEVALTDGFVGQNLGLVHACCHRLEGRGIEYDELYSAGCLGLCKAIKGFDPQRGVKFSTYAVPVILGEIRCLFREGGTVKVGRTLKERSQKIVRMKAELSARLGREPALSELAEHSGLSLEQVAEAVSAAAIPLSLSGEEGRDTEPAVAGGEEIIIRSMSLSQAVERLSEDEKKLIKLRYVDRMTQSGAAKVLCTSQVGVSRREKAVLLKLRKELT